MLNKKSWLENGIIYSIYPQSFNDSNGDGIGDLKGIEEKLDYIADLGCNIIWMNPIFESPFRDAGYDISNYYKIAPRYGTEEDLKSLCKKANEKGIHIILDLVAGHTALECEWFQKSAEYDKNEYSQRYIWTNDIGDLGDGTFINGYSERDGSYMKNYYYCQPALNYGFANPNPKKKWQLPVDHPECVKTRLAMLDIMDYWSDFGVSGFRVDMAFSLVKNDDEKMSANVALWKIISKEFKLRHPDSILIAEWGDPEKSLEGGFDIDYLFQAHLRMYTTLFRFEPGTSDRLAWLGDSYFRKAGKGDFALFSEEYKDQLNKTKDKGYMAIMTGSHDLSRISLGRDREELKVIQAFVLTMPGIPLIYYGDEIGMRYIPDLRSVEGAYKRTGSRTPMQWSCEKNYGFSTADKIYIPQDENPDAPTVSKQENDPESLLNHLKKIIALRKKYPALAEDGDFEVISNSYPAIYKRSLHDETIIVALNPSNREYEIEINGDVLISMSCDVENGKAKFSGCGYIIYKLKD